MTLRPYTRHKESQVIGDPEYLQDRALEATALKVDRMLLSALDKGPDSLVDCIKRLGRRVSAASVDVWGEVSHALSTAVERPVVHCSMISADKAGTVDDDCAAMARAIEHGTDIHLPAAQSLLDDGLAVQQEVAEQLSGVARLTDLVENQDQYPSLYVLSELPKRKSRNGGKPPWRDNQAIPGVLPLHVAALRVEG